jgi:azurin
MIRKFIATLAVAAMVPATALTAGEVTIKIDSNDQMQFDKKAFEVVEGQKVTLILTHSGQLPVAAMGHNVAILKPGTNIPEFAMKCAPMAANDYLPDDEESKKLIIAATKMLGGGETDTITFTAPAAGEYPFLCTFPGHFAMMQGVMTVKPKP